MSIAGEKILDDAPEALSDSESRVSALALRETRIIQAARVNRDVFISYVMEDSRGETLRPAPIHLSWTAHVNECIRRGKWSAIIAPWGHGKTEQCVIGATIFDLGRNPHLRIKIISNSDENAKERIVVIRRMIKSNQRLKLVFPDLEPDFARGWSDHKLFVKRSGASKDPSVQAAGVLSSGIGGRADKLVFDDPVDLKNAIQEPKKRASVLDAIRQTWLSRIDKPSGKINYCPVEYIATVWHEDDATSKFVMKNCEFAVLKQAISEPNMNGIDCEAFGRAWRIGLWEEKFDYAALRQKRNALGERAYSRGFLNQPFSDNDIILKSFSKCLDYTLTPADAMRSLGNNWRIICGVDPAGPSREGFALFTMAVAGDTHIRVPLDIRVGAWTGRQAIEQCLDVQKTWNPGIFIVENNALQDRIRAWIQDVGEGNILTKPFQTGKNKTDPTVGIPGMDIEFGMGLWRVALAHVDHRRSPDCSCAWCKWIREVSLYPMVASSDILMASWFAREEARGNRSMDEICGGIFGGGSKRSDGGRDNEVGRDTDSVLPFRNNSVSRAQLAKRASAMDDF